MIEIAPLATIRDLLATAVRGSREIDARLHHLLAPDDEAMVVRSIGQETSRIRDVSIDGWTDYGALASQFSAPWYSSSTDDAAALARRILPLYQLYISIPGYIEGVHQGGQPVACLESPISSGGGPRWLRPGETMALAVVRVIVDVLLDQHDSWIQPLLGRDLTGAAES